MPQDRNALLNFLAEETHAAISRAQNVGTLAMTKQLNEAEELIAIRHNIQRPHDNEAQLELTLHIKDAA